MRCGHSKADANGGLAIVVGVLPAHGPTGILGASVVAELTVNQVGSWVPEVMISQSTVGR
jgi:hypothetical protein